MEKIYYQTLKETLFHEKLENGLEVYLLPKVGFEKHMVCFQQTLVLLIQHLFLWDKRKW